MKEKVNKVVSIKLHLIAVAVIVLAFYPLAKWYFDHIPLWGIDFYYTASLTKLLLDNFALPPAVWNGSWFTGSPFLSTFPYLHYYLIAAIALFTDLFSSIKLWMLASAALFFIGGYAVFYELSRDRVLSVVLSIAAAYSIGVYGALTWGGSLPNFATQAFYPWVVFFVLLHLKRRKTIHLLIASLLTGLSILGHPQITISYIYPTVAILYAFSFNHGRAITRVKSFFTLFVISILIGLPLIYQNLDSLKVFFVTDAYGVAASTAKAPSDVAAEIIAFNKLQPLRMFTDSQPLVFVMLLFVSLIFLFSLAFRSIRGRIVNIIPFLVLAIWLTIYIWLFSFGISIFHGGWYRLFWTVPLFIGFLVSAFWGAVRPSLHWAFIIKFSVLFAIIGFFFIARPFGGNLRDISKPDVLSTYVNPVTFGTDYYYENESETLAPGTLSLLLTRSQASSAFPEILSMKTTPEQISELRSELAPHWINTKDLNHRLYDADQTVNIWWSSHFITPLARGYFDPQTPQQRGYNFWVDASLNQDLETGEHQLAHSFEYPEELAVNNTEYLLDWYAIKYFEAGHAGPSVYSPLPKFLTEGDKYMASREILYFNKEKFNTGSQELHYWLLKDEYVTPILSATNAPTLGIVASEQGFETVVRALADANLNSKAVISIRLDRRLDKLKYDDLTSLDALLLYDYTYNNKGKAFGAVDDFLKLGKNVFIETGVETKESDTSDTLPAAFPFDTSSRGPLGSDWDFGIPGADLTKGVSFSKFDPPIFDESDWKFAYTPDEELRAGSEVILRNHDVPVLIRRPVGEGNVIWSGMNLPYHVTRFHNSEEVEFFENILENLLPESNNEGELAYDPVFTSNRARKITASNATGVLLKEQAFPGWKAKVKTNGSGKSAKIYKAGPSFPGFMYIRLPEGADQAEVTFNYRGSPIAWIFTIAGILIAVIIIEKALVGGWLFGKRIVKVYRKSHKYARSWWEKEEEY